MSGSTLSTSLWSQPKNIEISEYRFKRLREEAILRAFYELESRGDISVHVTSETTIDGKMTIITQVLKNL